MDVDERREATLIHDDTRCQDIGELFIMRLWALKVQCLLFIFVFWCVLFVCRFMVFEVCKSMEMSF